jgi:homoserine O-acetyltransferase/O-succinyltransferase
MRCLRATRIAGIITVAIFFLAWGAAWADESLRYADLGDFQLDNGTAIRNCRIAYRTFGKLDAQKSNAVLIPTWLAGTTQELLDLGIIGPGKAIDSNKFFVIAVDAFGNGVSSSPSNSASQPDRAFPQFSIRDLVRAQYVLLTGHLKINHLHAVVGISMGGMQAFQWLVSYPEFMDKVVPIAGSPWMTSNDLLLWMAELAILDTVQNCKDGRNEAMKALAPVHTLLVWTPRFRVQATKPVEVPDFIKVLEKNFLKYNATDWAWQVKAIMGHNILKAFEDNPDKAAKAVRAKTLFILSTQDQTVYPDPAKSFAQIIKSETAELTGDCGHLAFLCEPDRLRKFLEAFLKDP